jgi:hypothetical protein
MNWDAEKRTKCERCGNTDVNEIIVFFEYLRSDGKEVAGDATTLAKFLYELKYPEEEKIEGAGYSFVFRQRETRSYSDHEFNLPQVRRSQTI